MFKQRLHSTGIIDLSAIPPCQSVLSLHLKRAAYTAYVWEQARVAQVASVDIELHGWFANGEGVWTDEVYPAEIQDIFEDNIEYSENEDENEEDSEESDDSEDDLFLFYLK